MGNTVMVKIFVGAAAVIVVMMIANGLMKEPESAAPASAPLAAPVEPVVETAADPNQAPPAITDKVVDDIPPPWAKPAPKPAPPQEERIQIYDAPSQNNVILVQ